MENMKARAEASKSMIFNSRLTYSVTFLKSQKTRQKEHRLK